MKYSKVIIGAGLYGLYSALLCAKHGEATLLLECEDAPFKRATYINQARVHMGYHYPRSISTALKSKSYFDRFNQDYSFCINKEFKKIYATSQQFSWTNAEQFQKFCRDARIPCTPLATMNYFNPNMCDGAFITTEYAYDAQVLKEYFLQELANYPNVELKFSATIKALQKQSANYTICLDSGEIIHAPFVLNATYASINQIHALLSLEPFQIKYELCEIILCKVSEELKDIGITVMDGPFFSIMPFGNTGYHTLTSVTFTPHHTSFEILPSFTCQLHSQNYCNPQRLGNCNNCPAKPQSAWPYMYNLAEKYLHKRYQLEYVNSLYSMKPILKTSEIDDSRPTVIRKFSNDPTFISVLSGKINTVYDLDEVLEDEFK